MNYFRKFFGGIDPYLMGAIVVLLGFGAVALISSSVARGTHDELTQIASIAIGLVLLMVLAAAHPKIVHRWRHPVALAAFAALALVLVFGRTVKGTRGWFFLGSVSFQPVELAKIALIIILASILPLHARTRSLRAMLSALFITAIFVVLTLLQPDFGSAMILIGLWCAMLLVSGVPRRYVFILFIAAVAVGAFSWKFAFQDYQ